MKKKTMFLIFGMIIFILIFQFIKIKDVLSYFKQIKISFIILAFIMTFFAIMFRSIRWAILLKNLKYKIKFLLIMKITIASIFVIPFLPRISSDFFKPYMLKKFKGYSLVKIGASCFFERILDILISSAFGLCWFSYIIYKYSININSFLIYASALIIIMIGVIFLIKKRKKILKWALRINNLLFKKTKLNSYIKEKIHIIIKNIKGFKITKQMIYYQIFFSIIVWIIHAFHFYFIVLAIGIHKSIFSIAAIFFISLLGSTLTFIPGGLGSKEAIIIVLFTLIGVKPEAAMAIALVERVMVFFRSAVYSTFYYSLMRDLHISKKEMLSKSL